ncbi:hypothetical protein [Aeromonas diversa]|uniref:hypothetical protein n=1 Tax=Aeromonas diversa TaxID=502790 RepID=UPI003462ACCE
MGAWGSGLLLVALGMAAPAMAGSVTVTRGDQKVDAFALRDQLAREHEWQEWLRHQEALKWLEVLPVNCELVSKDDGSYRCGGEWYRQYNQDGKDIYIRGEPQAPATPRTVPDAPH